MESLRRKSLHYLLLPEISQLHERSIKTLLEWLQVKSSETKPEKCIQTNSIQRAAHKTLLNLFVFLNC